MEVNLDLCDDDLELCLVLGVANGVLLWVFDWACVCAFTADLENVTLSGSLCLLLDTRGLLENLLTGLSR